jgi:hypothetical protein
MGLTFEHKRQALKALDAEVWVFPDREKSAVICLDIPSPLENMGMFAVI